MAKYAFILVLLIGGMFLTNCSAQWQVSQKPALDSAKRSYPNGVSESMLDAVKKNYLHSLKSNNLGVLESTVFYVVKFKLFYPGQDCGAITAELDRLAVTGPTPRIRYKAQLASNFMHNNDWLSMIKKSDYKDADQFFALLAETLQSKFFVYEN
jgi:hypothetical protein